MRRSRSDGSWTRREFLVGTGVALAGGAVASAADLTTVSAAKVAKIKKGGTLAVALDSELRTLDPCFSSELVEREVFYQMYDSLLAIQPNLKIVPSLATSWSYPTPTTLRMKLQQGVRFQDGTAFDASVVKWNIDRYLTSQGSFRQPELASISSTQVVDTHTIEFHLSSPDASLLAQLVDRSGMMVSPKAFAKAGSGFQRAPGPAGTGPFQFVEWVENDHLTLKRHPGYWHHGLPYLNQVIFHPIVDTTASLAALRTGQIDAVRIISSKDVASVKSDSTLSYSQTPGLGYDGITLNDQGVFKDRKKAQAVAWAIDRPTIRKTTFFDVGPLCFGPIPAPSWAFDPTEKLYAKADIKKARSLATGFSFAMKTTNTPDDLEESQLLKAQLAKAGITLNIQVEEFGQLLDEAEAGDFDAALVGWSGRIDPDGNMYGNFHTGATGNDGKYSNPAFDQAVEQARQTYNQPARAKLYRQAQRILQQDAGYIFIHIPPAQNITTANVKGLKLYPDGIWRFAGTWKSAASE